MEEYGIGSSMIYDIKSARQKSVVTEVKEMGGCAKLSLSDMALQEWVDVDRNEAVTLTLSDEELINAVIEENHEKMSEADSEEEDEVSWKDAVKGLAVFVKFV